jgi:hypothetical protein
MAIIQGDLIHFLPKNLIQGSKHSVNVLTHFGRLGLWILAERDGRMITSLATLKSGGMK